MFAPSPRLPVSKLPLSAGTLASAIFLFIAERAKDGQSVLGAKPVFSPPATGAGG
jgi:hypothetical protein